MPAIAPDTEPRRYLTRHEESRQWTDYWADSERLGYFPELSGRIIAMYPKVFLNTARENVYYGIYANAQGCQRVFSLKTTDEKQAYANYAPCLQRLLEKQAKKINTKGFQTIEGLRDEWLSLKATEYTPKTKKTVRDSFNWLIRQLSNITISDVCNRAKKLELLFYSEDFPSGTRRKHYGHLKAAFKKAVKWEYISFNPFDKFDKPSDTSINEKDFLSGDQFKYFIQKISRKKEGRYKRLLNICIVAEDSGIRSGEARHLKVSDVDFKNMRLWIDVTETHRTKNKRSRWASLTRRSALAIRKQMRMNSESRFAKVRNSEFIFVSERGTPISESTLCTDFREMRDEIFPDRKGVTFHSFRHAYATYLSENGVMPFDLKEALGHETIVTTEKYYVHKNAGSIIKVSGILAEREKQYSRTHPQQRTQVGL
jgi:integrase